MGKFIISKAGFTLIELLTVIALLGALAGIVLIAIDPNAQLGRARDTQRKSDIRQLQSALEIYRSDNGDYPTSLINCPTTGIKTYLGNAAASSPCTVTYLSKVPNDPKYNASDPTAYWNGGIYLYSQSGSTYKIDACLENKTDNDKFDTSTSPGGSGTCKSGLYYEVTNP